MTSWTIGDVTVTKIYETEMHWPFSALLPDVTPELVAEYPWLTPDYVDEKGRMILSMHALVIESQGKRIIVDTCIGNDKPRPTRAFNELSTSFLADLAAAGFPPDSIDMVTCTHLHVDHVGWNTMLVDGVWVPTFPNAQYLFGRVEYEHWSAVPEAEIFGDVMGDSVEPVIAAGLATLVESDHKLTDEVFLEPTPGHTPGHVCIHISSGGADAVITGDMIHSPVQFPRPELRSSADTDGTVAVETRQAFIDRYGDSGTLVIGTHFGGPTAALVTSTDAGYRFG